MTHLDLFSGIGGFALAAKMAGGIQAIGFSEIEPYACRVLAKNFPDVPNYGDIRKIKGVSAELISGGFPCQPFSHAGKRRGAEDDRHLWPEMLRVITEAHPRWVLGENVTGIIGMELDNVLSDLEKLGYETGAFVIPACAVDAKHRRDRVWIVAHSDPRRPGQGTDVANTECKRLQRGARGRMPSQGWSSVFTPSGSQAVSNASCGSGQGPWSEERSAERAARWEPEPNVGRVVNGLPNRAHRLRGLGNAIVPQVAAEIFRMIVRTDRIIQNLKNKH